MMTSLTRPTAISPGSHLSSGSSRGTCAIRCRTSARDVGGCGSELRRRRYGTGILDELVGRRSRQDRLEDVDDPFRLAVFSLFRF